MVTTESAFTALVLLVAVQRLLEVRTSRQHEGALKQRGGVEHAPLQVRVMVVVHTTWLMAMLVEVWWAGRPFYPGLAAAAALVFVAGQALRLAGRRALGPRWTVTIVAVPGAPLVSSGIFRYLKHPIYVGVACEIAALPLMHTAWITAVVFSCANALVLWWRIRAEELALGLRARR